MKLLFSHIILTIVKLGMENAWKTGIEIYTINAKPLGGDMNEKLLD